MGARTIPEPHPDEVDSARFAIQCSMERTNLDPDDEKFAAFIEEQVAVKSQMAAEIRWLRNILHKNVSDPEES